VQEASCAATVGEVVVAEAAAVALEALPQRKNRIPKVPRFAMKGLYSDGTKVPWPRK